MKNVVATIERLIVLVKSSTLIKSCANVEFQLSYIRGGGSMHLIMNGSSNNANTLRNEEFIYQLLEEYPAMIGMTRISTPYVTTYVGAKPEVWGLSAFVLIAESHISIHTFVEKCRVYIDIFSITEFNPQKVIKDMTNRLQMIEVQTCIIEDR